MSTQILQIIPRPISPVAPVQAVPFTYDYALLARLPKKDQQLIRILGLCASLKSLRGVDYRTNHPQLRADAAAYTNGISMLDIMPSLSAIEWSNGALADPTLTSDIEGLLQKGTTFRQISELEMDRVIAFLEASVAT